MLLLTHQGKNAITILRRRAYLMTTDNDPLKYNKYIAGVLLALLVGILASLLADRLVHVTPLKKNAYGIEVAPESTDGTAATAAPAGPASVDELMNKVTAEEGRAVFQRKCSQCHTADAGQPHRVGPNLHGVFSKKAAANSEFNYSDALKNAGIVWDADHLSQWLEKPQTYLPGTKMSFAGLKDAKDRTDLIAFLMVETGHKGK